MINRELERVGLAKSECSTPYFHPCFDQDASITRVAEIESWLQSQQVPVTNWVALDDMDLSLTTVKNYNKKDKGSLVKLEGYSVLMRNHFVQTNHWEGLTKNQAEKAIQLLHLRGN